MATENIIALIFSGLALLLSGFAVALNVFQFLAHVSRLSVKLFVTGISHYQYQAGPFLRIQVFNKGPHKTKITMICMQEGWFWWKRGFAVPHYNVKFTRKQPWNLEQADDLDINIDFVKELWIKEKPTRIGVATSNGKIKYARRRDVKEVYRQYLEMYGDNETLKGNKN